MRRNLLSVVVPFYNEAASIPLFFPRVLACLDALEDMACEIVCVNDGSRDATLDRLLEAAAADTRIRVIDLTRNFGKEAALTAGLEEARGDAVVPFDADLQDPPEVIAQLVAKWREGFDVVVAKRVDRSSDGWLKRYTAALFYRVHNRVAETPIPENVGDFRLMSREVVEALRQLRESRRFMKGLFAWLGYRTAEVAYVREVRSAGDTKFSGWKLWNLAIEGLTSFSTMPLRIWSYVGAFVALLSFVYAAYLIVRTAVHGADVPGYASIFTAILFFGGIQLIGIGIIGEYIGRIYMEAKNRPVYLVRQRYERDPADAP
ncbi:MAG: glycosyltransferase family 2 protein [Pseudomonadota bacterium]